MTNFKNVNKAELIFLLVSGLIDKVNLSDMPPLGDELKGGEDKFLHDGYYNDQTSFVQSVEMTSELFSDVDFVYRVTDSPASRKHKSDLKKWIDLFIGYDRTDLNDIAAKHYRSYVISKIETRAKALIADLAGEDKSNAYFWIDGYCKSAGDIHSLTLTESNKLRESLTSEFLAEK